MLGKIPSGVPGRRLGFDCYQTGSTDTARRDLTQAGSWERRFKLVALVDATFKRKADENQRAVGQRIAFAILEFDAQKGAWFTASFTFFNKI